MRGLIAIALSALFLVPAVAQETPWRQSVTTQIEAFRSGDAEAALEMAGAAFKATYQDAERFLADVSGAGYAPIVNSRSHSFGEFREIGDDRVAQEVNFVGPDQSLYEAVYDLVDEPDEGWRVNGVVLRKTQGMGV